MLPTHLPLSSLVTGNTFSGRTIKVSINDSPADLTGAEITMGLRRYSPVGPLTRTYSLGDGLFLSDAVNGEFQILSQIIDLPPAFYFYDIRIQFASGVCKTYISGTWNILPSISPL